MHLELGEDIRPVGLDCFDAEAERDLEKAIG